MKSYRKQVALGLTFILLIPAALKSQEKLFQLKPGIAVTEILKAGEKHKFPINPGAGKFAYFILQQDGIDAVITVYDPDGKKIQTFDSPNGSKGPEPVTLFTDRSGAYLLEVSALGEKEIQGKYTMKWVKLEPTGATPQQQIDQIFTPWNSLKNPGASVGVEKDGKIVFSKGYGSAELEYNVPITSTTVFHIASVSKQFTCFSILLLQKEGKLSIYDDIRKYLPEVPDFGKTITLNHLMHHTSGLRDQWELLAMAGWRLDDIITKENILNMVRHQRDLNFNPGDEFLYCNTGFTLLAEIVARVSGETFPEFTRKHIFGPLKMSHTLFYDDCEKIVVNRAYSFYADTTGYKKSILSYSNAGATSLFTTSEDLCRWAANFENPVVGGRDIISQMNQRGILNRGDTLTYAMGQDIVKYKGLKMIIHGGADAGYRSILVRFPDQKFSVNVLSNYASFDPGGMALTIADLFLKDKEAVEALKKPETAINATPDKNVINIPYDMLISYCGKYEWQPSVYVTISMENEKLFVEAPELPKTQMTAVSADEFDVKPVSARVRFIKDDSGKVIKMLVRMGGGEVTAPRMPDFDKSRFDLKQYTGDFFSPELSTTYSLIVENNRLVARHFRTGDVSLTPLKADGFSGDRWYFSKIEFVRDRDNRVTGFNVSGSRVRNLKFEKMPGK